jgi:YebC/PmpR family DNA-binding regulatory protein
MAGHSQFKNIMRRKGAQDIKRGKIFTKIIREVIVAAKSGAPDIEMNPRLRAAVLKARAENMPKDKIEAAIAKGSGTGDTDNYEAVRYEAYGPSGVAMIIEALTDNRNRTASEIRSALTKHGGNLGETGSVGFMFSHVGLLTYPARKILEEAMLEAAIEAGADNCETSEDVHQITCAVEAFASVRDALSARFGDPASATLSWIPTIHAPVDATSAESLMKLVDVLEDNDDVQDVFTNIELSATDMEKLSA